MSTEKLEANCAPDDRSLSVVLLCFNDAATIGTCVQQVITTCRSVVAGLQVIVVDDGSTDRSWDVLRRQMSRYRELEVVRHTHNLGYGPSVNDGIERARHRYIFCVDGDGQFDPAELPSLLPLLENGCDIVSGWRHPRADQWYRRLLGWLFQHLVGRHVAPAVADVDCGFKLFRLGCARQLFPALTSMAIWVEIMGRAHRRGFHCVSVPVRHRPRRFGRSATFRVKNVLLLAREVLQVVFFHHALGFDEVCTSHCVQEE